MISLQVNQNHCVALCVLLNYTFANLNIAILTILLLYDVIIFMIIFIFSPVYKPVQYFSQILELLMFMHAWKNKVQLLLKPQWMGNAIKADVCHNVFPQYSRQSRTEYSGTNIRGNGFFLIQGCRE